MMFNQTYHGWKSKGRRDAICPDCELFFIKDGPRQLRCIPCGADHKIKMDAMAWQRRRARDAKQKA